MYETYKLKRNEESHLLVELNDKIYPNRNDSQKDDYDLHYE